jgi:hypothetical protein
MMKEILYSESFYRHTKLGSDNIMVNVSKHPFPILKHNDKININGDKYIVDRAFQERENRLNEIHVVAIYHVRALPFNDDMK